MSALAPNANMCDARAYVREGSIAETARKLASGRLLVRRPDTLCVLIALHHRPIVWRGHSIDLSDFRRLRTPPGTVESEDHRISRGRHDPGLDEARESRA